MKPGRPDGERTAARVQAAFNDAELHRGISIVVFFDEDLLELNVMQSPGYRALPPASRRAVVEGIKAVLDDSLRPEIERIWRPDRVGGGQ